MKLDAPFQLDFLLDSKAVVDTDTEDGSVYVQGYASDFGLDRQDEIFEPGAFEEGMKAFRKNPVVLYHHKHDQPLGQVTEFEHRPEGLWVKARLDAPEPNTNTADIVKKVVSGTIRGFSIGGKFHRRKQSGGQTRIHAADILELSLTPTPVNPRTLAEVATKAFPGDEEDTKAYDELTQRLQDAGDLFDFTKDVANGTADIYEGKADLSEGGRRAASKKGYALPDGSFPIVTVKDLENAISAYGRAKDKAAAKAHIIKRAKALSRTDLLPEGWS